MLSTRSRSDSVNSQVGKPLRLYAAFATIADRREIRSMILEGQLDEEMKGRKMNEEDLSMLEPEFLRNANPDQQTYTQLAWRLCLCEAFSSRFSRAASNFLTALQTAEQDQDLVLQPATEDGASALSSSSPIEHHEDRGSPVPRAQGRRSAHLFRQLR